jgi:hypothetical protein
MSSPTRLNSLRLILGRELEEDFRKAGSDLMDRLFHDFEREILLAEALLAERILWKRYTTGQQQIWSARRPTF